MIETLVKDYEYLESSVDDIFSEAVDEDVKSIAEKYRIFPKGTPFEGKYNADVTPYMIEPMECLSPQSPVEVIALIKAAQLGATANTAENRILYEIACDPGPLLYVTATDELAQEWGRDRLEPMLDLAGMMDRIKPTTQTVGKRGTGNRTTSKTYIGGGKIFATSYNRVGTLRMTSFRTVIMDEVDAAPYTTSGSSNNKKKADEGNPIKIAEARTTAYEGRKKILLISTPLIKQTSRILKAFKEGDQRYYHVKCPFCGALQRLTWKNPESGYNLKYEVDSSGIIKENSVYYECIKCKGKIRNYHKSEMLQNGKWIPTNHNCKKNYRSYHVSALYAPIGMVTWDKLAQEWVDAQKDTEDLRTFINLKLGEAYEERGESVSIRQLVSLRCDYQKGTIPKGVLMCTLGCDVQRGTDDGSRPARIEAELCGFGESGKTWSIDYYVLEGSVDHPYSGAFKLLKEKIINNIFPMMPKLLLIDAGYKTDVVYEFCRNGSSLFPSMGFDYIKGKLFREKSLPEYASRLYEINTGLYKERFFSRLNLERDIEGNTPSGYCHFPFDYPNEYFSMLNSEKRYDKMIAGKVVGYKWDKTHSAARNEGLDCRVYAMAAFDVFVDWACKKFLELEEIDYSAFWELFKSGLL